MLKVLIIEDSPRKREDIYNHLVSLGVNTKLLFTALSIDSALSYLETEFFDLVIVDMALPQNDNDIEVDTEGGVSILECLESSIEDGTLKTPASILVLTQFENLIISYKEKLVDCSVNAILYEHGGESWQNNIKREVRRLEKLDQQRENFSFESEIVIAVHGIRTHANWQKKLKDRLCEKYTVKSYNFNFFNGLDFFSNTSAEKEIEAFDKYLTNICYEYPLARLHIVCHSFGTYVVYHTLARFKDKLNIGNVILAGSVLNQNQDLAYLYKKHSIARFVNDCSHVDVPLLAAQIFSNRYSVAGIVGIKGDRERIVNRYFSGGHSSYFSDTHITNWYSIINQNSTEADQKIYDGLFMDFYYWLITSKSRLRVASIFIFVLPLIYATYMLLM
ncbi:TPA: hypothetical protein ACN33Q_000717 [Vibrio parahaemolyticus]|nr:alpha/beta hydrolase [Vibrio parahaemolyticus]